LSGIKKIGASPVKASGRKNFNAEYVLVGITKFLIFIILGLSVWRGFEIVTEPEIPPSPFVLKLGTNQNEYIEKPKITNKKKKIADALIVEANIRLAQGKKAEAAKLMDIARNTAPGYVNAESAFVDVNRGNLINESLQKVNQYFKDGDYDDAWLEFEIKARRDKRYFTAVGLDYAKMLLKQNYSASSASILMTYVKLFPKNEEAQTLLKSALSKYQK
jgi:hypothetical protein